MLSLEGQRCMYNTRYHLHAHICVFVQKQSLAVLLPIFKKFQIRLIWNDREANVYHVYQKHSTPECLYDNSFYLWLVCVYLYKLYQLQAQRAQIKPSHRRPGCRLVLYRVAEIQENCAESNWADLIDLIKITVSLRTHRRIKQLSIMLKGISSDLGK